MHPPRLHPARVIVPLLAVLLGGLAACAPGRRVSHALYSVVDGWHGLSGPCEQRLILQSDGSFVLGTRAGMGGLAWRRQYLGTFTGATEVAEGEASPLRFAGTGTVAAAEPAYCADWRAAQQTRLPLEALLAQSGLTASQVQVQGGYAAPWRAFFVATDAGRADRVALVRESGGALAGYNLDVALAGEQFYHARAADPGVNLAASGAVRVIDVPEQTFRTPDTVPVGNALEYRVLLNLTAAARITFGAVPGTQTQPCRFVLYTDDSFAMPANVALPGNGDVDANPYATGLTFFRPPGSGGGSSPDAYTWPVGIYSRQDAPCSGMISARLLAAHRLAAAGTQPAFRIPLAGGPVFWAGADPAQAGTLLLVPFSADGLTRAAFTPFGWMLALPAVATGSRRPYDPLGLSAGAGATMEARVQMALDSPHLALTPPAGNTPGLGPLGTFRTISAGAAIALPGTWDGALAAGETSIAQRIVSDGAGPWLVAATSPLPLSAEVVDMRGRIWAQASPHAQAGGFDMWADLPAGSYDLILLSDGTAGSYSISATSAAPGATPDAALQQCLLDAARAQGDGQPLRALTCVGWGVVSLQGLAPNTALAALDVSANALVEIEAVQQMTGLHALTLDGNRIGDLTPLLPLARLHRLSVAGNPLDPTAPTVLGQLAHTLTWLSLRDVPTLSEDDAVALKAAMPDTTIVTPGGRVLESERLTAAAPTKLAVACSGWRGLWIYSRS